MIGKLCHPVLCNCPFPKQWKMFRKQNKVLNGQTERWSPIVLNQNVGLLPGPDFKFGRARRFFRSVVVLQEMNTREKGVSTQELIHLQWTQIIIMLSAEGVTRTTFHIFIEMFLVGVGSFPRLSTVATATECTLSFN